MKEELNRYTSLPTHEERETLERYLAASRTPLLFGHISPDGDSVGSVLAMLHLLRNRGKKPIATMAGHIPNTLTWLPANEEILMMVGNDYPPQLDKAFKEADLLIALDFNLPSRTGKVMVEKITKALEERPRPFIAIDHHESPSSEFDFIISKPDAAATAELVTELFRDSLNEKGEREITPEIATCLLTGIITDTGLFNHSSSYPAIFEATADLLRCGADKTKIVNKVYHSFSPDRFRLEGFVRYEKIVFDNQLKTAYFSLSLEEQKQYKVLPGDTEGLVNIPLDVEGVEISAFFKETLYEGIKVSLRSKGNLIVNDIAKEVFGGGGHIFAAGAEYEGSIEGAIALFLEYLHTHKITEIEKTH